MTLYDGPFIGFSYRALPLMEKLTSMLLHGLSVIFFFNSLITAALAFFGLTGGAAEITKVLFYIFVIVFAGLLSAELVLFLRRVRASFDTDG